MVAICFDHVYFADLAALSRFIANEYGSWMGVPESHPDYRLIQNLAIYNDDYYRNVNGVVVRDEQAVAEADASLPSYPYDGD